VVGSNEFIKYNQEVSKGKEIFRYHFVFRNCKYLERGHGYNYSSAIPKQLVYKISPPEDMVNVLSGK